MATFDELWTDYARDPRPANVGAIVDGVRIGDIDDELQDIAGSFAGLRAELGGDRIARLRIALSELTGVLPSIESRATRAYFERLARLGSAILAEVDARL